MTTGACELSTESVLNNRLGDLQRAAQRTEETMQRVIERLIPVMCPPPPMQEPDEQPQPCESPIALTLGECSKRLNRVSDEYDNILDRLEV